MIGFIGTGNMGSAMAISLLFNITVFYPNSN